MKLINRVCYNCKSEEYDLFDKENGFNLVKCRNCGLLYVNPCPDNSEISKATVLGVHKGTKEQFVTGKYHRSRINEYLNVLKYFFTEESFQTGQLSWLDIGCGFGEFIEALEIYSNKQLHRCGIDPNEDKIKSA